MQFGFKNNHPTVLCTTVYIETVIRYSNSGSNVYSCLIDARKAIDHVHEGYRMLTWALSYADDITLLCPIIRGLNEMIAMFDFAKEYNIIFNPKKTVCIKFCENIIN